MRLRGNNSCWRKWISQSELKNAQKCEWSRSTQCHPLLKLSIHSNKNQHCRWGTPLLPFSNGIKASITKHSHYELTRQLLIQTSVELNTNTHFHSRPNIWEFSWPRPTLILPPPFHKNYYTFIILTSQNNLHTSRYKIYHKLSTIIHLNFCPLYDASYFGTKEVIFFKKNVQLLKISKSALFL